MATVKDIMTEELATVGPQMSLREALEILRAEEVSGAPVLQGGEVVGVVSVTDLLEFEATSAGVPTQQPERSEWAEYEAPEVWEEGTESPSAFFVGFWSNEAVDVTERFEASASPEWDQLENHVVAEVMTRQIVALAPDAEIEEAAQLMLDAEVQRLLVLDDGELAGIVTATDVVRAVAEHTI